MAKKKTIKKPVAGPKKRGRPNTYDPKFNAQVTKLCLLGATDAELARFFEVSETTIYTWKKEYPDFLEALKKGKELADAQVSQSLYRRAIGYSHKEERIFCSEGQIIRAETIKHYPPEVVACIFWLKNRRSDLWRDKPKEVVEESTDEIKRVVADLYNQLYNTSGKLDEKAEPEDGSDDSE